MKKINGDRLYLGIFLLSAGIFMTFAMGLVSLLLYIGGAVLIIYNVFSMAAGITQDSSKIYIPKGISGIIIGVIMLILPKFFKIGLPMIAGIFFIIAGVTGFFNGLERKDSDIKKRFSGILSSVLFTICGIFFLTNPTKISGWIVKIVSIGFILIGMGIISSIFVNRRNKDTTKDVIQLDNFNVKD